VPLDEIARRAGVGAGTVYRHFPTKEALFEAIVVGNIEELTDHAHSLAAQAEPGAAFFDFFTQMIEHGAVNRAFTGALTHAGVDLQTVAGRASQGLLDALGTLLAGAQQAGTVREDLTTPEVKALLIGVFAASDWLGGDTAERRHLTTVVCDGFRRHTG
jgi:AcrR family transcriptional regulator